MPTANYRRSLLSAILICKCCKLKLTQAVSGSDIGCEHIILEKGTGSSVEQLVHMLYEQGDCSITFPHRGAARALAPLMESALDRPLKGQSGPMTMTLGRHPLLIAVNEMVSTLLRTVRSEKSLTRRWTSSIASRIGCSPKF